MVHSIRTMQKSHHDPHSWRKDRMEGIHGRSLRLKKGVIVVKRANGH